MINDLPPNNTDALIFSSENFSEWTSLNDSIMGGSSQATCRLISKGLLLEGELIEEGGGFVSCRSPILSPSLDLSRFKGLRLEVDGEGRTLKLALACKGLLGLNELMASGLRWIASIPTNTLGITKIQIPFNELVPAIRAKRVPLPIAFDPSGITQFQVLHSKFGHQNDINPGFMPGKIRVVLRSISAYSY